MARDFDDDERDQYMLNVSELGDLFTRWDPELPAGSGFRLPWRDINKFDHTKGFTKPGELWPCNAFQSVPVNILSGQEYSGYDMLLLQCFGAVNGYNDPRYGTEAQFYSLDQPSQDKDRPGLRKNIDIRMDEEIPKAAIYLGAQSKIQLFGREALAAESESISLDTVLYPDPPGLLVPVVSADAVTNNAPRPPVDRGGMQYEPVSVSTVPFRFDPVSAFDKENSAFDRLIEISNKLGRDPFASGKASMDAWDFLCDSETWMDKDRDFGKENSLLMREARQLVVETMPGYRRGDVEAELAATFATVQLCGRLGLDVGKLGLPASLKKEVNKHGGFHGLGNADIRKIGAAGADFFSRLRELDPVKDFKYPALVELSNEKVLPEFEKEAREAYKTYEEWCAASYTYTMLAEINKQIREHEKIQKTIETTSKGKSMGR